MGDSKDKDLHAEESLQLIRRALALNPLGSGLISTKECTKPTSKINKEAIESFSEEIDLAITKAGLDRYRDTEKVILARSHFERAVCLFREKKFRQCFADLDLAEGYDQKRELTKSILSFCKSAHYQRGLEREIFLEKLMEPSPEAEGLIKHLVEVLDEKIKNAKLSFIETLFNSGNVTKHHKQLSTGCGGQSINNLKGLANLALGKTVEALVDSTT